MHKVLILSIAALSVAETTKVETSLYSAVSAVHLIKFGPKGAMREKGVAGPEAGGAVYTRWARTMCPTGATIVYASTAATTGSMVDRGTSDTFCMPETPPQYLSTDITATFTEQLNSMEYETRGLHQHHSVQLTIIL